MKKFLMFMCVCCFVLAFTSVSFGEDTYVVDANGIVKNAEGEIVGRINSEGMFANLNGEVLGYLDADGYLKDASGRVFVEKTSEEVVTEKEQPVIGVMSEDDTI